MTKLLAAFKADPTPERAKRILKHCHRHPFAALLAAYGPDKDTLQEALTMAMGAR